MRFLINGDRAVLKQESAIRTEFDPACRAGGMLSIAKEHVLGQINPNADFRLFGQKVNDETYGAMERRQSVGSRFLESALPQPGHDAHGRTKGPSSHLLNNATRGPSIGIDIDL